MGEKLKLNILNLEEETANTIIFVAWMIMSVAAFTVVCGFLNPTPRDWISLVLIAAGIVIRILEKNISGFKKYAKYAYMTITFWCTVVVVVSNDGKYAAATQVYFMFLTISIVYYDVKMVIGNAIVTIVSNVGALILFPEAMLKLDNLTIWFFIFLMYLIATVLSAVVANHMRHMLENVRQMKVYEDELLYWEQLEKKEKKHSEFIHNINHYFMAIGELARVEHCNQILKLVEELNGTLLHNERIIYTVHKVLNAILSKKASEALEKQIEVDVYVEPILKLDGIADVDLVAMFGNLLDNSIEAAEQCEGEKRKISVRIYMEKEGKVCVVKIVNYFSSPRIRNKSGFISTKKNWKTHGIGIRSIESTAKKYKGYLQCVMEEDCFSAILILPVKK